MGSKENKKQKNYSGVTLAELMVTISIIALISAMAIFSLNSARTSGKIESAQRELSSEMGLAKTYALQGKIQGSSTPCGYGIRFENNGTNYFIFYNPVSLMGGKTCEEANTDSNTSYRTYQTGSGTLNSKTLSGGAKLSGSSYPLPAGELQNAEIYFTVPHGKVFRNGSALGSSVSLTLTSGSISRAVNVSGTGLITIGE